MTVELGSAAPNVTAYLIAWLLPLAGDDQHIGAKRWQAGDPRPYFMVNRIDGPDDEYQFSDQPLVSIHVFADDYTTAARLADKLHRRMRKLIEDPSTDVTVPTAQDNGSIVNVTVNAEWVQTVEVPTRRDYGDTSIERFVGRYRLSLHFV
jgi:hypothetical protein